jgi:hypothetical protein
LGGPSSHTGGRRGLRRVSNDDVEDLRNQKDGAAKIQADSSGYGECNKGRDKVEVYRKGRGWGSVVNPPDFPDLRFLQQLDGIVHHRILASLNLEYLQ